ncbi:MAG TPA: hypothetical protein VHB79_22070 [Polyangiaceae bacterium]|nr:hypothetical protein [Polyangiaceae bacterium]
MKTSLALVIAGLALALLGACRKHEEPVHRTEPWLAHPSASGTDATAAGTAPRRFHFNPDSRVRFSLLGRKGKLSGSAPVQSGSLQLDPRDLTHTSATLTVDLAALTVDDSNLPEGMALGMSPSAVAQQWLELGAEVPAEKREQFRVARFELSSVEGWSGAALDFSGRRRTTVRVTAVGTLLLHGFRAPVRVELALTPQAAEPGAGGHPGKLSIRSASALVLPLAPHDISARSPSGVVDAAATARATDFIGKNARIELELLAEPESAN